MAEKHFYEQKIFSADYLIPFFEKNLPGFKKMKVLEVGCAEGGFLEEMQAQGVKITGLELLQSRIDIALKKNPKLNIICGDITDAHIDKKTGSGFNLIVMRDTIEHIPDRNATFSNLHKLLLDDGFLFITFPPRFSAFAGHQQNCKSFIKFFPYLHYLPAFLLKGIGKVLKEDEKLMAEIAYNYKIGLSISKFESYYRQFGFKAVLKDLFFSRPVFKIRYGLKTMRFPNIPVVREFMANGCEYLLQKTGKKENDNGI
jgi:2-polyprenyl-3-methyl-5-hydroxy-6-metoxy-1,4-benzoquinol methylase